MKLIRSALCYFFAAFGLATALLMMQSPPLAAIWVLSVVEMLGIKF